MSPCIRRLFLLLTLAFANALHADKPEIVTRSFKVTPAFLAESELNKDSVSDPFADRQQQNKPLKQLLEEAGIGFPEGSSVSRGALGEIVCRNTEDNLERLRKYIDEQNTTVSKPGARLTEKMSRIIFPTIHFDGVTAEEALKHLSEESRKFDTGTKATNEKGVKIILRSDDTTQNPTITLDLKNVPMSEALRYVTELAQLHFKVEADSVLVVPLSVDISERITRNFWAPHDFLSLGMSAEDPSAAPADPFAAQPSAPVQPGGKILHQSAKQVLEAQGITFPEGSSAYFNPVTGLLTVTNTQPNIDLVEAFFDTISIHYPATLAHQLIILEGPGELIRTANAASSRTANARAELETLLDHAKKPGSNVRVVADAFLEGKSGMHCSTTAVREHVQATGISLDNQSRATASWDMLPLGLTFKIDHTLGPDGSTIDSNLEVKFHPFTPRIRQLNVTEPLSGHDAEFPFSMAAGAEFRASLAITNGATKLIGVSKPAGLADEKADVLLAVFLTSTIRRLDPRLVPIPPPVAINTSIDFHSPPGLLESLMETSSMPLREWLEKVQGIAFPPGAVLKQRGDQLQVTNTPAMIEAIGALIIHAESSAPKTITFTLHTIEAPATLLRDLSRQASAAGADDTTVFAAADAAVTRGEARFIESLFIETKSGIRSRQESMREHSFLSDFGPNAHNLHEATFDMRRVGSVFEIEPCLSADGRTVELNYAHEFHPAPPETRGAHFRDPGSGKPFAMPATDFHVVKTTSGLSMAQGGTKLISLNKPTGREAEGKLWATFLKCDVVPQVAEKPSRLFTRSFHVDQAALLKLMHPDPGTNKSAKQVFEEAGIEFPDGASANYGPATNQIVIRNTQWNLERVETFLVRLGGDAEPKPPDIPKEEEMIARSYKVPPDFLSIGARDETSASDQVDPFETPPPPRIERRRQSILESSGITFPNGSSASYNPATSTLIARNTRKHHALVEALVARIMASLPRTVTITTQVIEAPGPLLRRLTAQAASKNNHRAELDELLAALKRGDAQSLGTNRIESKPGTRATTQQGTSHRSLTDVTFSKEGVPEIITEERNVGFKVELEPTVNDDGQLVDLVIGTEFHTTPPIEHRERILDTQGHRLEFPLTDYHVAKLTTATTIADGTARLITLYKPTGRPEFEKEDILQAIFITCDILRAGK